jgi:hypothetical protein
MELTMGPLLSRASTTAARDSATTAASRARRVILGRGMVRGWYGQQVMRRTGDVGGDTRFAGARPPRYTLYT